jgi:hypothetical protein
MTNMQKNILRDSEFELLDEENQPGKNSTIVEDENDSFELEQNGSTKQRGLTTYSKNNLP